MRSPVAVERDVVREVRAPRRSLVSAAYTVRTVAYRSGRAAVEAVERGRVLPPVLRLAGREDTVKVVRPRRTRRVDASPAALTERIRLAFEARLEAREPEAA